MEFHHLRQPSYSLSHFPFLLHFTDIDDDDDDDENDYDNDYDNDNDKSDADAIDDNGKARQWEGDWLTNHNNEKDIGSGIG